MSGFGGMFCISIAGRGTVDSLIMHTPRDRPKGMHYEGVCVIGEVDLYGSEI